MGIIAAHISCAFYEYWLMESALQGENVQKKLFYGFFCARNPQSQLGSNLAGCVVCYAMLKLTHSWCIDSPLRAIKQKILLILAVLFSNKMHHQLKGNVNRQKRLVHSKFP